ncbi:MAG: KpsF/GutQ family sugar-phosphate isomerase [Gammaproteobacteria bacterium AqS3]|nr:KpsF/GutQ family sugar-phosphate isomerase [Gammaproteobacteria bacterium AqS3]
MSPADFDFDFVAPGRRALLAEGAAVSALAETLGEDFQRTCEALCSVTGRIVVTGVGKSGHIAAKIAATFSSTGSPAQFLHAAEAAHGDIGALRSDDAVLALSNSGSSDELTALLPVIAEVGSALIAVTASPDSPLGKAADICLRLHYDAEACPNNLSPTTSTTLALALGDALAVALMEHRGLTPEEFARAHPAGRLGRRLLYRCGDVCRREGLPLTGSDTPLSEALVTMSGCGFGFAIVCDSGGALFGVFSDGDLRRALQRGAESLRTPIGALCTRSPVTLPASALATEAIELMERRQIYTLPVVEDGAPVGLLTMHDLVQRGVV